MWPFGTKKVHDRLAGAASAEPFEVSVLTTIVSPSAVVSPFTGMRAGLLLVELLERMPAASDPHLGTEAVSDHHELLATVVLGDVATLRDEDGDELTLVAHRARIEPALPRHGGALITRMPSEIVPLLHKATGRGVLCYRELTLCAGDKVRLRAVIEPTRSVVADAYRSGTRVTRVTRVTYVARDDLAPVVLEEVFEASAS